MDILHRGTIPEEKQYVATCSSCETKVVYKLKEVEVTHSQRDGSYHVYNCPLCGKKVYATPQLYVDPYKKICRPIPKQPDEYYNDK